MLRMEGVRTGSVAKWGDLDGVADRRHTTGRAAQTCGSAGGARWTVLFGGPNAWLCGPAKEVRYRTMMGVRAVEAKVRGGRHADQHEDPTSRAARGP